MLIALERVSSVNTLGEAMVANEPTHLPMMRVISSL